MIKNWYVTGDTHRVFSRFNDWPAIINNENSAIVILGDAGINYTLDIQDTHIKNYLKKKFQCRIYCLHGNHEARPQDVFGMELVWDEDVHGYVYMEEKWPNIRYFKDWGIYNFDDLNVAVIGGAYSVDKWWRLQRGHGWFSNEQLSENEMDECFANFDGREVDIVMTHTCPISWQPRDLFLPVVDQHQVDNSMELFLDSLAGAMHWKVWLFGHYHADRFERPGVEQYYEKVASLEGIWLRWNRYDPTDQDTLDWWAPKSPMFYADDKILKARDDYWKLPIFTYQKGDNNG